MPGGATTPSGWSGAASPTRASRHCSSVTYPWITPSPGPPPSGINCLSCVAYADDASYAGLYPLSLNARTQVLKGRLNSGEVIGYFRDLRDPRHSVRSL